ncbi:uncharacterized protein [Typha latifolia]|uniref:uncharacterized protein n=1 Tax=Typha latifolia TaxID=4733 RepID=UPI003C2CCD57
MDRRSWLWRRKSSEKSPGETESSGSVSSHSERYSDDQEVYRASPNHAQSPEVLSKSIGGENETVKTSEVLSKGNGGEVNEIVKNLTEKLSAALLNIDAKEDLVKQHAKVAEEAVLGWEKAEKEVAALKNQLNSAAKKNSTLEDRTSHLEGALKECVRQLRQLREEQEKKIQDAIVQQTRKWESEKLDLEKQVILFQAQLEAKGETSISSDNELHAKLGSLEKENAALKVELIAHSEDLQFRTLEKELSIRAAETASKQHLESIKKVAKLEAECRRLRAAALKSSLATELKSVPNSVCVESLTDSQSDSGERLFGLDNEPSCSDSWASALIAELDQFTNEKSSTKKYTTTAEIELLDDFLEMEKLAAQPEYNHENSIHKLKTDSDTAVTRDSSSKNELDDVHRQMAELEQKLEKMSTEKAQLEKSLNEAQTQLRVSSHRLAVAEEKSVELQRHLNLVNGEKHVVEMEVEAMEAKRTELELLLETAQTKIGNLQEKLKLLEEKLENEKAVRVELSGRFRNMEALESKKNELEFQLESANSEVGKLREKVSFLEIKVEQERVLSAELAARCENMDVIEADRKEIDIKLASAHMEIQMLQEKLSSLEMEVKIEKALSSEFASKYQYMEALGSQGKNLESQIELAHLESSKLQEKIDLLERKTKEESALSAELLAKCKSLEAKENRQNELEDQLLSAHLEIEKLQKKVSLLGKKVEEERELSAVFAVDIEASQVKENKLRDQLELAQKEAEELREKLDLLENEALKEKTMSIELAARCRQLEDKLSRNKNEPDVQRPVINGDLKVKKEKELTRAAGKLAECQKTIASLNQQLKSLATFDDFLLDAEKHGVSPDDTNGDINVLRSPNHSEHRLSILT